MRVALVLVAVEVLDEPDCTVAEQIQRLLSYTNTDNLGQFTVTDATLVGSQGRQR